LKDLKGNDADVDETTPTKGEKDKLELTDVKDSKQRAEIADHTKLYDPIKQSLDLIKLNVSKVEKLKDKDRKITNEKERKDLMNQMEKIMGETNANGAKIKKQLEVINAENEKYKKDHKDSARMQMRTNLYQTHVRRFHQCMNEFNSVSQEFKQSLQDRTRRQLKIVDKNISDDDVEKILESGKANDVIKQAYISEELEDVVRDIEDRHQDILKLERQVQEVFELFRDLAALVDLQQDSLDVIEARVASAKDYTEKAEVELKQAEVYQASARKKQCCIIMIIVAILVVILAPTLATLLPKS